MRLNIEWMAPWRYGKPFKNYLFHTIKHEGCRGLWICGLIIKLHNNATTHGVGFAIML